MSYTSCHVVSYHNPSQGTYGIGPGLAMGRSIGDHSIAEYGVTAVPELTDTPITEDDAVRQEEMVVR